MLPVLGLSDGVTVGPESVVVVVDGPRLATDEDLEPPQPAATSASEATATVADARRMSMPVMEPALSKAAVKRP
jgi:hypothetical protein